VYLYENVLTFKVHFLVIRYYIDDSFVLYSNSADRLFAASTANAASEIDVLISKILYDRLRIRSDNKIDSDGKRDKSLARERFERSRQAGCL